MRCGQKMLFVVMIFLMSGSSWALTPPIEVDELFKQADLVIRGEVVGVKCAPEGYEQSRCKTVSWYEAIVHVNTVKKGRWPGKTIFVRFRDIQYLKGCVGDADHVSRIGERGYYYLISRGDGTWAPINWSAVVVKWPGEGPLPLCR